jgi:hypothetical protein
MTLELTVVTSMDSKLMARLLSDFQRRLLTAYEVAYRILYESVASDSDVDVVSLLASLPVEISDEFTRLVKKIEKDSFLWRPGFVGPRDAPPADPTKFSAKLRQIADLLKHRDSKQGE